MYEREGGGEEGGRDGGGRECMNEGGREGGRGRERMYDRELFYKVQVCQLMYDSLGPSCND